VSRRDHYFSPSETADRLGVTVRALRVYERHGLVKPMRTEAGWRVYGPEQMARLHQVLALKGLGLPLKRIGELLAGRLASLDAVLAIQEQALKARKAEAERGLELLARARGRLASCHTLSLDDLTTLTRETTMTEKMSDQEWREVFEPLAQKHFTQEERDQLADRKLEDGRDWQEDKAALQKGWDDLIAEAKQRMAKDDLDSPETADLVRRWKAMQDRFTGGDPVIAEKTRAMWQEAMSDPRVSAKLPMDWSVFDFVRRASERLKAKGVL
jgi:DNA-binding transcriptional MerR regulator